MTPKTGAILIATVGPIASAVVTDLDAFAKAREEDPKIRFDWTLFAARIAKAAIVAISMAVGATLTLN